MYTIRQFRDNLREAFNKAEAGEYVRIERYGKSYYLKADNPIIYHNAVDAPTSFDASTITHNPKTAYVSEYTKKIFDEPTISPPEDVA